MGQLLVLLNPAKLNQLPDLYNYSFLWYILKMVRGTVLTTVAINKLRAAAKNCKTYAQIAGLTGFPKSTNRDVLNSKRKYAKIGRPPMLSQRARR
ncbi:MAG: hypothetical protein EZS28_024668 [Streblomastix strix]|uniref:Uncharacterized protein n=1 Tax=Streblomastix strix TaxID=222440 RepID=A0A5J4VBR1_9EUKA|nr:MAG: hypothetical protein EZS28_024668 [Streblomastix strix]